MGSHVERSLDRQLESVLDETFLLHVVIERFDPGEGSQLAYTGLDECELLRDETQVDQWRASRYR